MKEAAFRATSLYREQHTALLSFVTPAAAALWNMRWQVNGFVGEFPEASEGDVFGRFAQGSGLRAGNLKAVFGEGAWDDQLARFGEMLLLSSFALYEGWVDSLASVLEPAWGEKNKKEFTATLTSATGKPTRELRVVSLLSTGTISSIAVDNFQPRLRSRQHAQPISSLPALLTVMRAYKALRNSRAHNGGYADAMTEDAVDRATSVSLKQLGTRAAPNLPKVTAGRQAAVPYETAIGCTAVLLKVVCTVDAELGGSNECASDVVERVRTFEDRGKFTQLPTEPIRRAKKVRQLMNLIGGPNPVDPLAVARWLKSEGAIQF